jgi:ribosomal protein S27E
MASPGKQLICPECGQVMATASWGLFRGLRITAPEGFLVTPVSNDLMLRSTEQRLVSASAAGPEARRRRDFVLSHPCDRFYDIKCPNGHFTLRTAPQISSAIRRAPGDQVILALSTSTEV